MHKSEAYLCIHKPINSARGVCGMAASIISKDLYVMAAQATLHRSRLTHSHTGRPHGCTGHGRWMAMQVVLWPHRSASACCRMAAQATMPITTPCWTPCGRCMRIRAGAASWLRKPHAQARKILAAQVNLPPTVNQLEAPLRTALLHGYAC